MAQQDLTPQLRTRLNRVERAVGIFASLAVLLLAGGFALYLYNAAESRGWFVARAPFYTYVDSGTGFQVGDDVKLMGFKAGRITSVEAMEARGSKHNVRVGFEVIGNNITYVWTGPGGSVDGGTVARWADQGFLGKRELDLTRATNGLTIYQRRPLRNFTISKLSDMKHPYRWRLAEEVYSGANIEVKAYTALSNNVLQKLDGLGIKDVWALDGSNQVRQITAVWNASKHRWDPFVKTNIYELPGDEPVPVMDRINAMVLEVEHALPGVLDMTNKINAVLANGANLTSNLNAVAMDARPAVTNLTVITANLRDPQGSLGRWLIPTNLQDRLDTTLLTSSATLTNVDTNLVVLVDGLSRALNNLGDITSNLNTQVQSNSNMLTQISSIVVHSDEFIQGLKRHWLFRSAFKTKPTNAPPAKAAPEEPALSPKARSER